MKTGFKDLDNIVKIKGGDLIIVASRPAMGKTIIAQNILSNVAIKEHKPIAFFSLEESMEKIVNKLIIRTAMVEADKFKIYDKYQKGEILKPEFTDEDWDRIFYGINVLKDAPIFINATAPQTINDIKRRTYELKEKENIELIIIDYLQLIQYDKSKSLSRDNEVEEILKELKLLARELNVSIIVTSQLSRKPEERDDKRPVITDFTNTASSISNYADKILFLYRDSYYKKENKSNITEIIVAKNENGKTGTAKLGWMPEYCMFGNIMNFKEEKNG